jgi:hypothetical protein
MRKIPINKLQGQTGDAYTSIHPTNPPYIYIKKKREREIIMEKRKGGRGTAFLESENNQK